MPGTWSQDESGFWFYLPDEQNPSEAIPYNPGAAQHGFFLWWGSPTARWEWQAPAAPLEPEPAPRRRVQDERPSASKRGRTSYGPGRGHPQGGRSSAIGARILEHLPRPVSPTLLTERCAEAPPRVHVEGPSLGSPTPPVGQRRLLIEVGAGGGEYPEYYCQYLKGWQIVATDIADGPGNRGWLAHARAAGLETRFNVDANALEQHFALGSADIIVSTGCYGVGPSAPGKSYGLKRCTGQMIEESRKEKVRKQRRLGHVNPKKPETELDDRFLRSAHGVLKPGGRLIMLLRSNVLCGYAQQNQILCTALKRHNTSAASDPRSELQTVNLYADITWGELVELSKVGYAIVASLARGPEGVTFRAIDSVSDVELHGFNVQLECVKSSTPSCKAIFVEQPFWATSLQVDEPAPQELPPYEILGPDQIPADNDCFFHVLAHHLAEQLESIQEDGSDVDAEDIRIMLTSALAARLFVPPHDDFEVLFEGYLDGMIQADAVRLVDDAEVRELLDMYKLVDWPDFPQSIVQYVAQLIFDHRDVERLRLGTDPGRPNITIWGETTFLTHVAHRVFRRPIRVYATYLGQLRCIQALDGPNDAGAPINFFYDGHLHFTVIIFHGDPEAIAPRL